jgi:hypothetical protein
VGRIQPRIQWAPGTVSLAVKKLKREADHSPPSSAKVKNAWSYTSTPLILLQCVVLSLKKAAGQLYIYLYIHLSIYNQMSLYYKSRDSSVGIAPGYGLDDQGFESW